MGIYFWFLEDLFAGGAEFEGVVGLEGVWGFWGDGEEEVGFAGRFERVG